MLGEKEYCFNFNGKSVTRFQSIFVQNKFLRDRVCSKKSSLPLSHNFILFGTCYLFISTSRKEIVTNRDVMSFGSILTPLTCRSSPSRL